MFKFDALERAIRRHIAPDVASAMHDADNIELMSPRRFIDIPLQADCLVAHEKGLAAFVITASIFDKKKGWLGGRAIFTNKEFASATDQAKAIEYVFESAKQKMLHMLAEGELERIIKQPTNERT